MVRAKRSRIIFAKYGARKGPPTPRPRNVVAGWQCRESEKAVTPDESAFCRRFKAIGHLDRVPERAAFRSRRATFSSNIVAADNRAPTLAHSLSLPLPPSVSDRPNSCD